MLRWEYGGILRQMFDQCYFAVAGDVMITF